MASSPRVPQELLDKIIDNLHSDYESLKQCSLASSLLKGRSYKFIYSTIHLYNAVRIQRLRNLVDVNSNLLENVRELKLEPGWAWIKEDTDLPVILRRATSLRSLIILGAHYLWTNIHRDTRDALIQVFRSLFMSSIELLPLNWGTLSPELIDAFIGAFGNPSLQFLEISNVTGIPVTIFHRNIKLAHFLLTNVTFVGYGDVDFENPDVVPLELRLPYGLEIRHLCLGRMHNAPSLVPQLLNVTRRSLRALQFRQWLLHAGRRPSSRFTYDFNMLPALQSLEFHIVAVMDVRFNLKPLLRIAFQNIIDFVLAKPTAARIKRFRICFIASHPAPRPSEPAAWYSVSYALETMDLWEELDRIIDVRKEAASAVFRLEIDLASSNEERQPEELLAHREAWKEKIVRQLPLASRRGVLMTEAIPDVEM
ncbi:hypothetical protein Hypma_004230 [Hypsizygus marmoreus]|uniref:F-box domain-containing protein n=1 Tax=Hypsizygus marmoreus TaxID=39966 RepID=A0A369J0A5_HYPMA|nr:hypothetical protein Hypma_004230 [Hypsizygus marmoreus]